MSGCSRTEELADADAGPAPSSSEAEVLAKVSNEVKEARVSSLPMLGAAPDWELARLDGTKMSSKDLAGKVVVLDFWATWCGPCKAEIPHYIEMQRDLEEKGMVIVGVSLDRAGPEVVKKFQTEYGINYPLIMGDSNMVDAFGGIEAIPTTFIIDRNGQVRDRKVGLTDPAEYRLKIESLL